MDWPVVVVWMHLDLFTVIQFDVNVAHNTTLLHDHGQPPANSEIVSDDG